jgi:uncharacterized protein (DUF2147 family)
MHRHALAISGSLAALAAAGSANAGSEPNGIWIDHTGRGGVEISECGGKLCGRLVWLKDSSNKKECGTQIIGNAKPVGKDTWDGGWIYDPEKGEKYSVELKLIGSDKLRVVGYMGSKLFSETMIWKRPTADLKRCDDPEAAATPAPLPKERQAVTPPADNPVPKTSEKSVRDTTKNKSSRQPEKGAGCSKYFPQIGETISVPCER